MTDRSLTVIERAVLAILIGRHHAEQYGGMPDRPTALAVHHASGLLGGGARPDHVDQAARSLADRGLVELTRHGGHLAAHVTAAGLAHGVL
jgi:hypothetical protein